MSRPGHRSRGVPPGAVRVCGRGPGRVAHSRRQNVVIVRRNMQTLVVHREPGAGRRHVPHVRQRHDLANIAAWHPEVGHVTCDVISPPSLLRRSWLLYEGCLLLVKGEAHSLFGHGQLPSASLSGRLNLFHVLNSPVIKLVPLLIKNNTCRVLREISDAEERSGKF